MTPEVSAPGLLGRCEACVRDAIGALDCVVVPLSGGRGLGCVLRLGHALPTVASPAALHGRLNRALADRGLPPVRATHVAAPADPCWTGTPASRRRALRQRLGRVPVAAFVTGFATVDRPPPRKAHHECIS